MHRTRFYWIIKRKPNIHVLTGGWVMEFPTLLQGWVSHFCAEGRGWAMCFLSTTFPNAPAHPSPILFDQSLKMTCQKNFFALVVLEFDDSVTQMRNNITQPLPCQQSRFDLSQMSRESPSSSQLIQEDRRRLCSQGTQPRFQLAIPR